MHSFLHHIKEGEIDFLMQIAPLTKAHFRAFLNFARHSSLLYYPQFTIALCGLYREKKKVFFLGVFVSFVLLFLVSGFLLLFSSPFVLFVVWSVLFCFSFGLFLVFSFLFLCLRPFSFLFFSFVCRVTLTDEVFGSKRSVIFSVSFPTRL